MCIRIFWKNLFLFLKNNKTFQLFWGLSQKFSIFQWKLSTEIFWIFFLKRTSNFSNLSKICWQGCDNCFLGVQTKFFTKRCVQRNYNIFSFRTMSCKTSAFCGKNSQLCSQICILPVHGKVLVNFFGDFSIFLTLLDV